jgi:hypothetical protein
MSNAILKNNLRTHPTLAHSYESGLVFKGRTDSLRMLLLPGFTLAGQRQQVSGTALAAGKSRETPAASPELLSPNSTRRLTVDYQQTGAVRLEGCAGFHFPTKINRFVLIINGVLIFFLWLAGASLFGQEVKAVQAIVRANANALPLPQQLEKKIHVELAFLRRAVKLTAEQETKLASLDPKTLDEARNAIRNQKAGGIFRRQIIINGAEVFDPLRMRSFERELTKQIDAILDEEQKRQYATEKKLREAFQHELAVNGLIILLDKKLSLSVEQKIAVRESLEDWTDSGNIDFDNYFMNNNYLPACPDELIVKHLNKTQAKIYENTPRLEMVGTSEQVFAPGDVKIER